MSNYFCFAGMVAASLGVASAHADYLTAVTPIPGFMCMNLAISHDQVLDPSFSVPVYSAPLLSSPKVGAASIIPFIKEPFRYDEQFQKILRLNGESGWIQTKVAEAILFTHQSKSHP